MGLAMAEQALDVGRVWVQVRAHRRLLVVVALIGACLGLISVVLLPPTYTSETRVLMPPLPSSGGEAAERDGQTEVEVARSDVVLGPAGQSLTPPLTVRDLSEQVEVQAITPSVLQIVAHANSAERAKAIADAVAEAELAYLGQAVSTRSTIRATVLAEREDSLSESLDAVTEQVEQTRTRRDAAGPDSPNAGSDASALAQLTAEQAKLVLALDEVRGLIAGDETGVTATKIERASTADRPLVGNLVLRAVVGGLAALIVALVWLVRAGQRDRRLRYRDEVADAIGTVVIASVRSTVPATAAGWAELLAGYQPGTVDAWALRQVMRKLAVEQSPAGRPGSEGEPRPRVPHPRSMTVLSLAGDQRGLALGPQLASYAASLGIATRLVTAQGHDTAAALWAAGGAGVRAVEGRPQLVVSSRAGARGSHAELTVVLAVVDPRRPVLSKLPTTEVTVLAVSAGTATAEELAQVAVVADEAGRRITGVILADPDDLDRTTGRVFPQEGTPLSFQPARITRAAEHSSAPGGSSGDQGRGR
jgi:capsular polysaccharide biosynthesis protein